MRRLVGRDLAHEEQVGPALALLAARQRARRARRRARRSWLHVDQQGDDRRALVADRDAARTR